MPKIDLASHNSITNCMCRKKGVLF